MDKWIIFNRGLSTRSAFDAALAAIEAGSPFWLMPLFSYLHPQNVKK